MLFDRHHLPAGGLRLTAIAVVLTASTSFQVYAQGAEEAPAAPAAINADGTPARTDQQVVDGLFAEPAATDTVPVTPLRTETAPEGKDAAAQLDEIEVTGSRLSRVALEGSLPVTVISRDDNTFTTSDRVTVAHEYDHALQDANFPVFADQKSLLDERNAGNDTRVFKASLRTHQ